MFFQAGFDVLAESGYGGLKLASVCGRLGVTSGSFYHHFANWSEYTRQLITHWQVQMTVRVEEVGEEPDPRRRLDRRKRSRFCVAGSNRACRCGTLLTARTIAA